MAIEEIKGGGGIVVTGADDIERFRRLTIKHALRLEMSGMRRRGQSMFAIRSDERDGFY